MIRRFAYHAFWNFYDYLGTLVLFGTVYALAVIGIVILSAQTSAALGTAAGLGLLLGGELLVTTFMVSALMPFCARAGRGEPARWAQLVPAGKLNWIRVGKIMLVWSVIVTVLVVNFTFYSRFQNQLEPGPLPMIFLGINSVIGWLVVLLQVFLPIWLSAGTASGDRSARLKDSFRSAIMAFALAPVLWVLVYLLIVLVIVSGLYTRITFIFVLPVFASLSQTAYHLAVQYVSFIADARSELGDNLPVRMYKSRANELALNWEFRQPRRTMKELIRPWEY